MYRMPSFKYNKSKGLKLKAIETTEESTILYFTDGLAGGGWCNIGLDTYIIEKNSKTKLYLIDADGIAIAPERTEYKNNIVSFSLTFPPIAENCLEIDFIEETDNGGTGFEIKGITIKDNYSDNSNPNIIEWEEVVVTDDPKYAEGLIAVESITEKSGWGGSAGSDLGVRNCIKGIQQKAAKKGCCLAVVTNISRGISTSVTATIYKRP